MEYKLMEYIIKYLLIPLNVFADSRIINNPTGGPASTAKDVTNLVIRLQNIVFVTAGAIAVAMIIWGGVILATSGGNEERTAKGKKILTYSVGGGLLIFFSYFIIKFFILALGGDVQ